jgi:protein-L-isoaspartate(D-aspartate) O-methyltransferase
VNTIDFAPQRQAMVDAQIRRRGLDTPAVLAAMQAVPREAFVPNYLQTNAYDDGPLPLLLGQTISQPYIVALMMQALALQPSHTVLEIGTGSGYAAAVLAQVARRVYSVERHGPLAETAKATLAKLGITNVEVRHADGTLGWPAHAPYDAIVVAAGGPQVPEALKAQLRIGGHLVMPVGPDRHYQDLIRVTRESDTRYTSEHLTGVCFVPLIGEQGWARA